MPPVVVQVDHAQPDVKKDNQSISLTVASVPARNDKAGKESKETINRDQIKIEKKQKKDKREKKDNRDSEEPATALVTSPQALS